MQTTERRWLAIIIALALVLRLGAAVYLGESLEGVQQKRVQDQASYNALAQSLLSGRGYTFDRLWYPFTHANTPTAHWSFLYPIYLAGVYGTFGFHPLVARIIQAVLSGVVSVWLLFVIGKRLFGARIGLISAGLGAVYGYFIYHDAALMTESFFTLGVLAMLAMAIHLFDPKNSIPDRVEPSSPPVRVWLLLGVVLGVTALLRQTILLWLPFLIAWILWAGWGRLRWWQPLLTLGIMFLWILPWTVRNYLVFDGEFLPLNSNAGYALYSANHPYHGTQFDQDYMAPLPAELEAQGLNEAQLNTALVGRGLQFILQDPGRYLLLSLDRVSVFFHFWFSPESDTASNLMRVFSFGLFLPFFIVGLFISFRNWRQSSLFYLFAVVYSALHILTWASIRYRLPVDASLIPFAALAVSELAGKTASWKGILHRVLQNG